VCPVGAVHTMVPSGNCSSRQPPAPDQNVFNKWWHRLREEHFVSKLAVKP